jgi:hypothetical protein
MAEMGEVLVPWSLVNKRSGKVRWGKGSKASLILGALFLIGDIFVDSICKYGQGNITS